MAAKRNAIIIHGGGLVDPSKHVLMRLAKNLSGTYDKVYIGNYSFESLFTPDFINEYNDELVKKVRDKRGTYFGTCRGIDLCNSDLFRKAVMCLDERNIKTIIVAGGDGSSRQIAETNDAFMTHGINTIFPIPLTIDGINGGLSIGINEAVKESIRQIENVVSTSFQTRDNGAFGVVMVELQGRNRDDIIANVLKMFQLCGRIADYNVSELLLRVVPANFETNENVLIDEINHTFKRTLILVSEGAKERNPNLSIPKLIKGVNRKVRSLIVGHSSQSNNMMSEGDINYYNSWIDHACSIIKQISYDSFCIANIDENHLFQKPIDYYAKLNPRNGQNAQLEKYLDDLIIQYMSK